MKPTNINIAIAKQCAYKFDEAFHAWVHPKGGFVHCIPDYYGDLNTISAVIREMPTADFRKFLDITELMGPIRGAISYLKDRHVPTAPYLCEAFLRLHGEWVECPEDGGSELVESFSVQACMDAREARVARYKQLNESS